MLRTCNFTYSNVLISNVFVMFKYKDEREQLNAEAENIKGKQVTDNEGEERSYVPLTLEMECVLADLLKYQYNIGNKVDGG